jgi:regulation of enolase protein 1 (concanavalin A-like superfamily)
MRHSAAHVLKIVAPGCESRQQIAAGVIKSATEEECMNLLAECRDTALANGLKWLNEPSDWKVEDERLIVIPHPGTDFFRPFGREGRDNGGLLYKRIAGDFTAVVHAKARLAEFGDAAALTVRSSGIRWAKLCIERSPVGDVSLVSVVTNPWSDDCNGELLTTPECYLRITRKDALFGMHYSLDGSLWRFVRTFALELPVEVMVGIHAQAPSAKGCEAVFSSFSISPEPVSDFRSGE